MIKFNIIKNLSIFMLVALIIGSTSCKKDEDPNDGDNKTEVPTLHKDNLYNKLWQSQSGTPKHEFLNDGVYRKKGFGTWKWVSDNSIEIKTSVTHIWYFKYCQGDSMECSLGNNTNWRKMRDHDW